MIQKKLHIPGKVERASLEMDESWKEVSWWCMVMMKNIHMESHVEFYMESEWYWRLRSRFSHASTIQICVEKSYRLDNFVSHGLEIMSETTAKPMWKWNLESFAQEAS
jgi:hypothetical protein